MIIPLSIVAPFTGIIKEVSIRPGMHVSAQEIIYVILNLTVMGHEQRPLRSEFGGVITEVKVSKSGTPVKQNQILAIIEARMCRSDLQRQQQQHARMIRSNRGGGRTTKESNRNGSKRKSSESSQSSMDDERDSELRAWRNYRWNYPHHRYC